MINNLLDIDDESIFRFSMLEFDIDLGKWRVVW